MTHANKKRMLIPAVLLNLALLALLIFSAATGAHHVLVTDFLVALLHISLCGSLIYFLYA